MKRIAVLMLLVAVAAGWPVPVAAQQTHAAKSDRQSEKLASKQATALYKYQMKQRKAQEKAQRAADKKQQKAAKKYEKQQRKSLKNATVPAKHTS